MATRNAVPDASAILGDLTEIAANVQNAKETDKAQASFAGRIRRIAAELVTDESVTYLAAIDVSATLVHNIADTMRAWADDLSPDASVQWAREDVAAKLTLLEALVPFGTLTEDQMDQLARVKETLTAKRGRGVSGSGTRNPLPAIDGRPANVEVWHGESRAARQRGDTVQSAANIRTSVVRYLEKKAMLPVHKGDANDKVLRDAIAAVVTGETTEATATLDGRSQRIVA